MLPFEIREQLNLTLARRYLTFKGERAKRDCTSDISNIVVYTIGRHVSRLQMPVSQTYLCRVPISSRGNNAKCNENLFTGGLAVAIRNESTSINHAETRIILREASLTRTKGGGASEIVKNISIRSALIRVGGSDLLPEKDRSGRVSTR